MFKPLPRRLASLSFLVVSSVSLSTCRGSKRVPCLATAGSFNMFPTSSFTNFNFFLHIPNPALWHFVLDF